MWILKSATGGLLYAVPGLDFTAIGQCRSTPKLLQYTHCQDEAMQSVLAKGAE